MGTPDGSTAAKRKTRIGYDYVHSVVDDHARLAYSEILNDEKGDTVAGFFVRATEFFQSCCIPRIETVMTDNHWSCSHSQVVKDVISLLGSTHITIWSHCP